MRAKTCLMAMSLMASLTLPQAAQADAKSDFEARYAMLNAAEASRDAKAIKALLAPKFQSIDVRGEASNADEMIDDLGRFPPDAKRSTQTTIQSVTVKGDTALVEQTRDIKLSHPGMDGATHAIEFVTVSNDSWVQSPSGWLLSNITAKEMTLQRDGAVRRHMVKGEK